MVIEWGILAETTLRCHQMCLGNLLKNWAIEESGRFSSHVTRGHTQIHIDVVAVVYFYHCLSLSQKYAPWFGKKTSLFLGKIVCCTSDSLSPSNNRSIWEWIHDLGFKAPVETRVGIFFGGHNQTWQWKSLYQWRNSSCFSCFTILKGILPVHQKKSLTVVSTHPPKKWKSLFILTSIYSHQSGVVWK